MNAIRSFNTADGARDPNLLVDEAFKTICLTDAKSFLDCHTNGEAVEGFTSAKTALDRLVNGTIDKAKQVGLVPALEWVRTAFEEAARDDRYKGKTINLRDLFACFMTDVYAELHHRNTTVQAALRQVHTVIMEGLAV
ncbi:MAG: hypothetical protein UT33_C0008G0031 [Candidatus Peregrinibacteria bacterium GW2011_GWC2_39_14]|nr:MAG: hypothetical protein US92_C0004G0031 [Candidatus Peregrinibacteria bacterium GW2011_GWA2_38_36]KKR06715.1 MAG: hypothetical protein UT33_C0008G0031 [Candidatus Peregrinibacteria bacterium GW2011_GWC2_39_14]